MTDADRCKGCEDKDREIERLRDKLVRARHYVEKGRRLLCSEHAPSDATIWDQAMFYFYKAAEAAKEEQC